MSWAKLVRRCCMCNWGHTVGHSGKSHDPHSSPGAYPLQAESHFGAQAWRQRKRGGRLYRCMPLQRKGHNRRSPTLGLGWSSSPARAGPWLTHSSSWTGAPLLPRSLHALCEACLPRMGNEQFSNMPCLAPLRLAQGYCMKWGPAVSWTGEHSMMVLAEMQDQ